MTAGAADRCGRPVAAFACKPSCGLPSDSQGRV
jgi:hypothetical protein